ncbi:heterokaryon incompatibility protein-domain-containing protein [Sordaria brevicollis]|uniref:Heterokaryon incompatibility protein-domain-containing protein n=1 Tax=Sordaria brevicollis TaxID=83679 RepID=A0AAE0NVM2_SORBR|nr:heterokaryon incompatibility protein-domain-containing protein [Sordaria brevicollis]
MEVPAGASRTLLSAQLEHPNFDNPDDDRNHAQTETTGASASHDPHTIGTNERLCARCNEIKDVFDFTTSVPIRSLRTLDLLADSNQDFPDDHSDFAGEGFANILEDTKIWKVTNPTSVTCSFCTFLMDCASRMACHTTLDLNSNDWFLAVGVEPYLFSTGSAAGEPWNSDLEITQQILRLKLCRKGKDLERNLFRPSRFEGWENTHLIVPVLPWDRGSDKVLDSINWEIVAEWLSACKSKHAYYCNTNVCPDTMLEFLDNVPNFCLIDCVTDTIIPAKGIQNLEYCTLSYVWGDSSFVTSSQPEGIDAKSSVPILPKSNLRPRVVNDAMDVVRQIGSRYLWVDRYCIPQSDHNSKDIQIQKMGKIYSMSRVTIIAAAGNDAEYGLPGVGSGPRLPPLHTTFYKRKPQHTPRKSRYTLNAHFDSPWHPMTVNIGKSTFGCEISPFQYFTIRNHQIYMSVGICGT